VYHHDEVYDLLRSSGIEPFPSAGFTHRVKGGYVPNSHNCMPCELVNDRFKQMERKNFTRLQESRQKMVTLHLEILKVAETFPKEFITIALRVYQDYAGHHR
jgi:hypothetical protein